MIDDGFHRWITLKNNKIIYATIDYICSYNIASEEVEILMEYCTAQYPQDSVISGDNIIMFNVGDLYKYSLKENSGRRIIIVDGLTEHVFACQGDILYFAVDTYTIQGDYSTKSIESEYNGVWKMNIKTLEKVKISDERPKRLYIKERKLYNENFTEIIVD